MFFSTREEVIRMTPLWKGERMEDGRPKVPDSVLDRLRKLTMEEVWMYSWARHYEFQVETELKTTHPTDKPLVGRAATCTLMPYREDLHIVTRHESEQIGFTGGYNKNMVQRLEEHDVAVVNFYDKVMYGTFFGGNLSTAVANRTKDGGVVIWGGIRDLDQIKNIPNLQIYYRGSHPTAISAYQMVSYNGPCQIGSAVCMPGDVVYGSSEGVCFIPAHLAEATADDAEKMHIRDIFGFQRLRERRYTTADVDANPWAPALWEDFLDWFENNPEMDAYRYLDFHKDAEDQKNGINVLRAREVGGYSPRPMTAPRYEDVFDPDTLK